MTKKKQIPPVESVREVVDEQLVSARVSQSRMLIFTSALTTISVAFAILAVFARRLPYFPIDLEITHAIQRISNPTFAGLMNAASYIGFFPNSAIIVLLVVAMLGIVKMYWEALMCIIAASSVTMLNLLLKSLVHRPRPDSSLVHVVTKIGESSFPSGHVMFYTVLFGYLFFLAYILLKPGILRRIIGALCVLSILLVAPSRIYLGQHWASDTVGAYLAGSIWLLLMLRMYRWGRKKRIFV